MTVTDATATPADDSTGDDTALDTETLPNETVVNDAVAGETVLPDTDEPVEEPDDDAVMGADAEPTVDVLGVDGEAEPVLADNELAGQDIDLDDTPPS
ncbi:hypothetical protein [Clavibacter michiganensis]|uniref:hypothetical protein n=1 Tax=Clavibacter michiganensis TaxID=28447 RepID=UPI0026DB86F9|nr:hypothetical protein [Clavibacter michiganensis]MDO4131206.1 hypothetical protein [Clavibacter michiganensis]MDO4137213.1 hypothetical protein [Clavibacter michiganensis]